MSVESGMPSALTLSCEADGCIELMSVDSHGRSCESVDDDPDAFPVAVVGLDVAVAVVGTVWGRGSEAAVDLSDHCMIVERMPGAGGGGDDYFDIKSKVANRSSDAVGPLVVCIDMYGCASTRCHACL